MAKGRSSQNTYSSVQRDITTLSLAELYARRLLRPLVPVTFSLPEIEDRREFHPLKGVRPARVLSRTSQRMLRPHATQPGVLRFSVPEKVAICIRRKRRREVLFAKRQTGRGAYSRKYRNYWSDVSC